MLSWPRLYPILFPYPDLGLWAIPLIPAPGMLPIIRIVYAYAAFGLICFLQTDWRSCGFTQETKELL